MTRDPVVASVRAYAPWRSLQALTATLLLLPVLLLFGCGKAPPAEQAITAAIKDIAAAAEAHDADRIMKHLGSSVSVDDSRRGPMNRFETLHTLRITFLRYRRIKIVLTNIQVTPDPVHQAQAQATFNALVTGGSGGLLPDTGQLYRLKTDWEQDGDQWKLVSARVRRALEGD